MQIFAGEELRGQSAELRRAAAMAADSLIQETIALAVGPTNGRRPIPFNLWAGTILRGHAARQRRAGAM